MGGLNRGIQIRKNPHVMSDYDNDLIEFERNREKYHHIRAKQENDSFEVIINRKYKGCRSKLSEAVKLRDFLFKNDLIHPNRY